MTTERLYYSDSYLRSFRARVTSRSADGLVLSLDRTAFYPTSGGQPFDLGSIAGIDVLEVSEQDDNIVHRLSEPLSGQATDVDCSLEWDRRFDHMQQHTGQHLLSAVFVDLYGWETVSFHMGSEVSTIDLKTDTISAEQLRAVEHRSNEVVAENRLVTISFEEAGAPSGLRKATERTGVIRIITIDSLDRSACGGTHVRTTGEIGAILLRGTEKLRGNTRLEFICGLRAIDRARADYTALDSIARAFSAGIDNATDLVRRTLERLEEAEKGRKKLAAELAQSRGRAAYLETLPRENGLRIQIREDVLGDEVRAEAQAFTQGPLAVFVCTQFDPPAIAIACSTDVCIDAGKYVKEAISKHGGRGGGSATFAQASVGSRDVLPLIRTNLLERLARS